MALNVSSVSLPISFSAAHIGSSNSVSTETPTHNSDARNIIFQLFLTDSVRIQGLPSDVR